jgi:hypothetical protein
MLPKVPWPSMPRPFTLTEAEYKRFFDWAQQFKGSNPGAIGGMFTFSFTPTTIGTIVTVKHSSGAEIDLTDYDLW